MQMAVKTEREREREVS